jgi:drug/metabolite transporter (DMT)-like permease
VSTAAVARPTSRARIWTALLVASLGWGMAGVATRAALAEGMGPYAIVTLRTTLGFVIVIAVMAVTGRPMPSRAAWRLGLVLGVVNMAIPYVLTTFAVQNASAGFVGLLIANIPLATAVWAHFLLPDERLHRGRAAGLGVSLAGVIVLMASGDSGIGEAGRPLVAVALTMGAMTAAAWAGVFGRRHAPYHGAFELAATQFGVAAVTQAVLMLAFEGLPREATPAGWALIGVLGAFSTVVPFVLFYWMLQRITATETSLAGYIVPIVGLVGGALFLGERITPAIIGGGALVLAGVVLTQRSEHRRRRAVVTDGLR